MNDMEIDAQTFADWQVDYVKLDGCYAFPSQMDKGIRENMLVVHPKIFFHEFIFIHLFAIGNQRISGVWLFAESHRSAHDLLLQLAFLPTCKRNASKGLFSLLSVFIIRRQFDAVFHVVSPTMTPL